MQPVNKEFEEKLRAEANEHPSRKRKSPSNERAASPIITQYHSSQYALMRSAVMEAFDRGESIHYKKVEKTLKSYPKNDPVVIGFFKEHGKFLFRHALLRAHGDKALLFLAELMPHLLLIEVLRKNNFSAIKSFLVGEAACEEEGPAKQQDFDEQKAKFKALLKIDPNVKDYIESPSANKHITENIQLIFDQAVRESGAKLST